MRKNYLILVFVLFVVDGFTQTDNLKKTANNLMGKTIAQGIVYLQMDSTCFHTVQEPFGVLRGVSGNKNGFWFYLYTERETIPLNIDTTGGKWVVVKGPTDLQRIEQKKII